LRHNYSVIWPHASTWLMGGIWLMVSRNYELAIAALGGALAMVTFLFLWERSAIEAAAKETPPADWSGGPRMFEPLWPYQRALGLLPPDQQDLNDEVGPADSDSPYDVISPYLHNVPRPATPSAAPRPTKTASLRPAAPKPSTPPTPAAPSDFWVPDVSSLLIPAASLGMLVIPLAALDRADYSQVVVWSPAPAPSGDPPGIGGPFHLFFTTDSPTGVAPVAESGGGGGLTSSTTSTVTNTVTNAVSSTTTGVADLASSTTSATTALISSTTSTATGLVSSVLRRH
jgi:hypothetical protein